MNVLRIFHPFPSIALIVAVVIAGCKSAPKETTESERPTVLGPENYAVVEQGRIITGPMISGALKPKQSATVRAEVAGAVLSTSVDAGEQVRSGMLLAKIDDRTIQSAVASARSALENAKKGLDVAQRDQQRQEALLEAGAVAARDVENARRNTIAAQAAVAQAQSQLTTAQKQLSYTEVRAPFSGSVSEKYIAMGDIVQPGTAMFSIIDPSSMELEASIPADEIAETHVGDVVEFRLNGYPDRTFHGRITRINPSADPVTRQGRVYVEIPNSGHDLLADLFAEGYVTAQSHNGLTVPTTAINRKTISPTILRVSNGQVEQVDVSLGPTDTRKDRVQIIAGLNIGDTVLTGAGLQTPPGTTVRLTSTPQAAATSVEKRGTP